MARPVSLHPIRVSDDRGQFEHYWDRLRSLEVPVPKTAFVDLEETNGGYRWDTDRVLSFMESNDFQRAFVRTQRKAATVRLQEGSFIHRRDPEVVDRTIRSLLDQNDQQGWPHGGGLVVREWLDLDWCRYPTHGCHPSVRYFIDDGTVIGQTPRHGNEGLEPCNGAYDYLEERRESVEYETPRRYAERVARAFSETWAVDFVAATTGRWYCLELNFNGIYWNRWEQRWWNMAGQGEFEPFSPVEIHSAALWGVRPRVSSGRDGPWW